MSEHHHPVEKKPGEFAAWETKTGDGSVRIGITIPEKPTTPAPVSLVRDGTTPELHEIEYCLGAFDPFRCSCGERFSGPASAEEHANAALRAALVSKSTALLAQERVNDQLRNELAQAKAERDFAIHNELSWDYDPSRIHKPWRVIVRRDGLAKDLCGIGATPLDALRSALAAQATEGQR